MRTSTLISASAVLLLAVAGSGCGDFVAPLDIHVPVDANSSTATLSSDATITGTVLLSGVGRGISDDGLVTGFSYPNSRQEAFLWDDGFPQSLGVLDETVQSPRSLGLAVNDRREVVGRSVVGLDGGGTRSQAFLWSEGTMVALPDPDVDRDVRSSYAGAINGNGQAAGTISYVSGGADAVVWQSDQTPVLLPALGSQPTPVAVAVDMNDAGQVVGWSRNDAGQQEATVWENGEARDLGLLGGNSTEASAINEAGDIVGMRDGRDIVFWPVDGSPQILGQPGLVKATIARARVEDINDDRQIVGVEMGLLKFPSETLSWLWQVGTFTELQAPEQFLATDPRTWVEGINNAGQAVGHVSGRVVLWQISTITTVEVDIKPGSDPNAIACSRPETVVPVAILSTQVSSGESLDFGATTVDHATVAWEGAGEYHVNADTGEPFRHEEDVDGDGDLDLVLHFQLVDTGLTCSATEGTLTGETFDGTSIEGTDTIRMIGS